MPYRILSLACFIAAVCAAPQAADAQSVDGPAAHRACPSAPNGPGLLADGDFSAARWPGALRTYGVGEFAPQWRVIAATIDLLGSAVDAPYGVCSVDLDGTPGFAEIEHDAIPVTPGASYDLTFLLSGDGGGPPAIKRCRFALAHDRWHALSWNVSNGNDAQHGKWQTMTWLFRAAGPSVNLWFDSRDTTGGQDGCVIANVAIVHTTAPVLEKLRW